VYKKTGEGEFNLMEDLEKSDLTEPSEQNDLSGVTAMNQDEELQSKEEGNEQSPQDPED